MSTEVLPPAAPSVGAMFWDRVTKDANHEAFQYPLPDDTWTSMTWAQAGAIVEPLAAGLLGLGLGSEDRVAILANTRLDWVLADLAIMCAGAATTAVYPNTGPQDIAYIVKDSGSRVVIAEDRAQLDRLYSIADQLVDVVKIVLIDGEGDDNWAMSWNELIAAGTKALEADPELIRRATAAVRPDDLATLIYTSGTTGRPKGVELLHSCWVYEGIAVDSLKIISADDLHYLWLPLSHSFGKVLIVAQLQIGFSQAVDGRVDRIVTNLGIVRPTFMCGVPRVFEKVTAGVRHAATAEGGIKAKLYKWAEAQGLAASAARQNGGSGGGVAHALADRLVMTTVRKRFGGRLRFFISGSAALAPDIASWFDAIGLPILEGYGLTETSAGTFLNRPTALGIGTVGATFTGTEVRIAEDGEILLRGPGVMRGYYRHPDATTEVMSEDRWFSTGDIGTLDEQGRLTITDRKKDLVKTSGGKYIAPGAIEAQWKAIEPLLANVVVVANNRNFATALLTLDVDALARFAASESLVGDYAALTQNTVVHKRVTDSLATLNSKVNRWETIKDFRILPRDLSLEDGEVTPSMKIRRAVVENHYFDLLGQMYSGAAR